jgi:hypothetical protein
MAVHRFNGADIVMANEMFHILTGAVWRHSGVLLGHCGRGKGLSGAHGPLSDPDRPCPRQVAIRSGPGPSRGQGTGGSGVAVESVGLTEKLYPPGMSIWSRAAASASSRRDEARRHGGCIPVTLGRVRVTVQPGWSMRAARNVPTPAIGLGSAHASPMVTVLMLDVLGMNVN